MSQHLPFVVAIGAVISVVAIAATVTLNPLPPVKAAVVQVTAPASASAQGAVAQPVAEKEEPSRAAKAQEGRPIK